MLSWLFLILSAWAVEPELVLERVAETQEHRVHRLDRGAPKHSEAVYRKAASGKVTTGLIEVSGHKAKKAWGVAVVDVPIAKFWAAINDDKGKVGVTKLAYTEVFSGGLCGSPRRVFQYLPVPLLTDRWWVAVMRKNSTLQSKSAGSLRELTWATDGNFDLPTAAAKEWGDKGMHVESTKGAWLLIELDAGHTLVEYYTWSDPGGSVPAGMASNLAANGIEDTMKNMSTLAMRGTHCKLE